VYSLLKNEVYKNIWIFFTITKMKRLNEEEEQEVNEALDVLERIYNRNVRRRVGNLLARVQVVEDLLKPIPDAVIANILNNLPVRQLLSLKRLSKRFHAIIVNYMLIERTNPLFTWGNNTHGALGKNYSLDDDDDNLIGIPMLIDDEFGGNQIVQVSCSNTYDDSEPCTGAVTAAGQVYMWGEGEDGRLGDNNIYYHTVDTPILINGFDGARIVQLSCGAFHCGAVTSNGQVYMWGNGDEGVLGDNNLNKHSVGVPTLIDPFRFNGARIIQISCGIIHNGAVTSDGQVYMWGNGYVGILGNNNIADHDVAVPTLIDPVRFNGARIMQISCGGLNTGAVTSDGQIYMWGSGKDGNLGNGGNFGNTGVPILIDRFNGARMVQISCGTGHTGAVTSNGEVYMWGNGSDGRLGDNRIKYHRVSIPTLINRFNGARIVQISCGDSHTGAITSDGHVYMWGNGHLGVLGDNNVNPHSVKIPTLINRFHDARIVYISCGGSHTAAIAGIPQYGVQPLKIASNIPICADCSTVTSTKCSTCNVLYCESCFTRAH
jgi:alpha-tubulin suppressor-like RCC1 family protein